MSSRKLPVQLCFLNLLTFFSSSLLSAERYGSNSSTLLVLPSSVSLRGS